MKNLISSVHGSVCSFVHVSIRLAVYKEIRLSVWHKTPSSFSAIVHIFVWQPTNSSVRDSVDNFLIHAKFI